MKHPVAFFLAALALTVAACDGGGGGGPSSQAALVEIDGCERAYEELLELDFTPVACADGCPEGSHCDEATDRCAFECINHTDCGADGWLCDCGGTCVVDPGATPPGDASCARDAALLAAIKAPGAACNEDLDCPDWSRCGADRNQCAPRACAFDDECPHGSHCDLATGRCDYACLPDAPGLGCAADERCDCFGRCVDDGPGPAPEAAPIQVELSRTSISGAELTAPVTITVTLSTDDAAAAFDAGAHPRVQLEAEPGIAINGSTGTVTLATWAFSDDGATYAASASVTLSRSGSFRDDASYLITVRAPGTRAPLRHVLITPLAPAAASPVPDGVYDLSGAFEVVVQSTTTLTTQVAGARALVRDGRVYMQSEGGTFNPAGYGVYALLAAPYLAARQTLPFTPGTVAYPHTIDVLAAPTRVGNAYTNGVIRGVFGRPEILHGTFRYTLTPRPEPLVTCERDADCPTFYSCVTEVRACSNELTYDPRAKFGASADVAWKSLPVSPPGSLVGLEALVCGDPGASSQFVDRNSRPHTASGELRCLDGKPMRAAQALSRRDGSPGDLDAADLAAECVGRLANGQTWGDACINPQRFQSAFNSGWLVSDKFSARLYQRIMSQWLEVHTFLASQLRTDDGLAQILEDGTPPSALSPTTIASVLDQGLGLGLDVAERLLQMPADRLRFADYRALFPDSYWTFDERHTTGTTARDIVGSRTLAVPAGFVRQGDRLAGTGALTGSGVLPEITAVAWNGGLPTLSGKHPVWRFVVGATSLELGIDNYAVGRARTYARRGTQTINGADLPFDVESVFLLWRRGANRFEVYADGVRAGELTIANTVATTAATITYNVYGWSGDAAVWTMVPEDREVTETRQRFLAGHPQAMIPADDQNHGTPVALLEYATEYLRYGAHAARGESRRFYEDCVLTGDASSQADTLARLDATIRRAQAADALATDVYFRARSIDTCTSDNECGTGATCGFVQRWQTQACLRGGVPVDDGPPPWEDRFQRARRDLAAEISVAQGQHAEVAQCRNPLGVEAYDLPLYFSDTQGVNTSFFAASDYLLERLAEPAVSDAAGRFASARSTWLARRNAQIQQLELTHERERRLEDLEIGYASQIAELCGLHQVPVLDVLDRFDPTTPPELRLTAKDCFAEPGRVRGVVGQKALALDSARLEVRHAHERSTEAMVRYDEKDRFCTNLENDHDTLEAALIEHQERSASVRDDLGQLSVIERAIGSIDDPVAPLTTTAQQLRVDLEAELAASEQAYELLYTQRTYAREEAACWLEAQELRRGIREAARAAASAFANAEMAALQLRDGIAQVEGLVAAARARLGREQARPVPSLAHHYWLDEELDAYRRSFARAQRYVYLTMVAVEYEFQQSLGLRSEILAADRPAVLENLVALLRAEVAARTINGRRPEESTLVLSVREDVLRLADGAERPGERAWTSAQRFGTRLMAPQYAYHDDDGRYLGQAVPFTLDVTGALQHRCAERIWRVNATIQVDAPGVTEPNVPVFLLKNNTFASQSCEGHGDDEPYQVTSMRPGAQLLTGGGQDVASEASAFTGSLLQPWLNVPRGEFYRDDYRIGSSGEFAGRGLYGEYILLFPEEGLLELTDPTRPDFPLAQVEDVLVRFDLISVDDL